MNVQALEDGIAARVYGPQEIAAAVGRLARSIAQDYAGRSLVLLGVLKGALYLTVDLGRALSELADGPSEILVDYISVASYKGDRSSGKVELLMDAEVAIEGRNVLVVEDIADNGLTLSFLLAFLERKKPNSLRTCVLFDKPARRQVEVPLHYVGLTSPDAFVVGYGLDYQELYRNLPYLGELKPEAMRRL